MSDNISYCGLDCHKCEAYLATINNDDELKSQVAKKWSKLNNVNITKDMINCLGCKGNKVKTPFCEHLCKIRNCAIKKDVSFCINCETFIECKEIKMIIDNNDFSRKVEENGKQ